MGKEKRSAVLLRLVGGAAASLAAAVALPACGEDTQGLGQDYDIIFSVTSDSDDMGALQIEVRAENGQFLGRNDAVECRSLVDAIVAANYVEDSVIRVGLISLQGIDGPRAVLECGLRSRETPDEEDFDVEVTDASDTNSLPISPEPDVAVTAITRR